MDKLKIIDENASSKLIIRCKKDGKDCFNINYYVSSILNKVQDGVYITQGDSKTIFVNKAYEKLSGTKKELFLGKKCNR